MRMLPELTLLNELFDYNPSTGIFTRIKSVRGVNIGDVAGSNNTDGYVRIAIGGIPYSAHRIAWKMVTGDDPYGHELDHKNLVRHDNRFCNLRLSNRSLNRANISMQKNNKTGYKGVWLETGHDNLWVAAIAGNFLGHFRDIKDAARAYNKAAVERFGEHARINKHLVLTVDNVEEMIPPVGKGGERCLT